MAASNSEADVVEGKRLEFNSRMYKGILMMDCEAEQIEAMNTKEDDIWVCSYPRSGMYMTHCKIILFLAVQIPRLCSF